MIPVKFKKNLERLAKGIGFPAAAAGPVFSMAEALAAGDPLRKTRMEFSLQLEKGCLGNRLRLVNYDIPYSDPEAGLYFRRVKMIEELARPYAGQAPVLRRLFHAVRRFGEHRLPVCLGIEAAPSGGVFIKIYVNFFGLNRKSPALGRRVMERVVAEISPGLQIERGEVALFAVTVGGGERSGERKIYYLRDKGRGAASLGLGRTETKAFRWLNARNKHRYFAVMRRHGAGADPLSRTLEVSPRKDGNFLERLCEITGNGALYPEIRKIMDEARGEPEVVTIENGKTAIYATFLDYGKHDWHIRQ